ncbi:MAG: site-2 protease family protein [Armatimonadetes bacterium]|nr:site-2 protease family protein [Armatimonadota bacterium]
MEFLAKLIIIFPCILIALSFHEYAHGKVAYALGDPTAKYQGRLSLNPLSHLDPIGSAVLLISSLMPGGFIFGWAKPVPINPYNFKNPRQDSLWVGLAGPFSNFALAALAGLLVKLNLISHNSVFFIFINYFVMINISLGVFNLIPVPPLDGSKILSGLLPYDLARKYQELEYRYGLLLPIILIFIFLSPIGDLIIRPLFYLLYNFFMGA